MFASVVIITRNRSESLRRCLNSVAAQDYKDVEWIVVDNASTDDTARMVETAYPSVILLRQPVNTGVATGRNIGIRRARGEICVCIDDDAELVGAAAIRTCVEYFEKEEKLGCLSMRVVDEHDRIVTKLIPRRDRRIFDEDRPGAMFSGTAFAVRRSAFMEAGEFWPDLSPYFGEDAELSYRLLDKGYTILHTPHISAWHYASPAERHKSRRLYYGTRNVLWMGLRNLPWYSVFGLTLLSWGYFFLVAVRERQLVAYFQAVAASVRHASAVYRIRKPVSKRTRQLLWRYSGLILF